MIVFGLYMCDPKKGRLVKSVLPLIRLTSFTPRDMRWKSSGSADEKMNTILLARYQRRLHGVRKKPLRIVSYVERTIQALTAILRAFSHDS